MTEFLELIKKMNDKIETLEKEVLELKGHKDNGLNLYYSSATATVEKAKGKWDETSSVNKGLTINNKDGSTFAIMSGGEIVTPVKLNRNITLNVNISENTSAKELFEIIQRELNKLK